MATPDAPPHAAAERERRKLLEIAEHSSDLIATADLQGRLTYLNRGGRRMLGVGDHDAIDHLGVTDFEAGQGAAAFFPSTVVDDASDLGAWQGDAQLRNVATGKLVDVCRSTFLVRDPETREPLCYATVTRDITQQKAAERALRLADERLRAVLTAADVGLWHWDPQRDALLGDRNFMRLFGLEVQENAVPIAPYLDRIHPEDRPRIEAAVAQALGDGGAYDEVYRVVHEGGDVRWLHARGFVELGDDGKPVSFPGIGLDITRSFETAERLRESYERLRESDERYRALLESVDDGFCIIQVIFGEERERAVDYRFVEVNPSFSRQTGLVDPIGKTARELVPDLDHFWFETYGRVALTGETARFERCSPAMRRWFEVEAMRVGAPERRRVAILFRDVTARRSAEEALKEADRRKDAFIATLAHELRNPLAPVRTAVEILRRLTPADPRLVRAREVIDRQVTHMARLIDDLLDVSRIARGKLALQKERCDLGAIARQVSEDYRASLEAAGLTLVVAPRLEPMWVEGDPVRLAQMIGNLLHNAGHFTERGGRVEVRADLDRVSRLAVVSVSDTGVGIAPALLSRLFDPFSQADQDLARSKGGLGLGLALTKGLAELHGGEVTARSEGPGRGASFTIRIPALEEQRAAASQDRPSPRRAGGLHILVVEDNRDAAETLAELLQLDGHEVRLAFDGAAAVAAARERRPDVVISDLGLPGELDGYAVARSIRSVPALKDVRLIALSGYVTEDARRRSRESGFDMHLAKPPDLHKLEQELAEVSRTRAARD